MALAQHLRRHDEQRGGRIAFRRDCPICRRERVAGTLPDDRVLSMSARATIAIGSILAGGAMPSGVAVADRGNPSNEGVAIQAPPVPDPPTRGMPPPGSLGAGAAPATEAQPQTNRRPNSKADQPDDAGQRQATAKPGRGHPSDGARSAGSDAAHESPPPAVPVDADPPPEAVTTPAPPAAATEPDAPPAGGGAPEATPAPAITPSTTVPAQETTRRPRAAAGITRPSVPAAKATATVVGHDDEARGTRQQQNDTSTSPRASAAAGTYVVRPGDCLWRIAAGRLGEGASDETIAREVTRLWKLNAKRIGTGNPDLIYPGQTLAL